MKERIENEKNVKLKVIYQDKEYELEEQEFDRIIAIASKKLRDEIVASKLGLGIFSVKDLTSEAKLNPGVRVIKNSFDSEFYKAMNETILYAIETDMLENYRTSNLAPPIQDSITSNPARNNALNATLGNPQRRLGEFHNPITKQRALDITEIYSRKLQNFFTLLSREVII